MNNLKKAAKAVFSMKTAIAILLLLIIACIAGSVIPQGEIENYYSNTYPGNPGRLILLLGLNDVFHSLWFLVLTGFLCLNLLGCNLLRFPVILRQSKTAFTPERCLAGWDGSAEAVLDSPEPLFQQMGFRHVQRAEKDGQEARYAVRNRIGLWGAWLTHLGMLIIIVGFALGQMLTVKYTVYGIPGETKPVGETGYTLTIDDFDVTVREDNTVEQYTAQLTMTDTATGESRSGEASVNHPLSLFGMKLYQNSMGWAARVEIEENGESLQSDILCAGEYTQVKDKEGLIVMFNAFYPDLTTDANGMPKSASSELNRPGYLYSVYYNGDVIGMNVLEEGEEITIDAYTVHFSQPQNYTLIQIKHDPFTWLAFLGGLVILLALFIAFYLRTEELWAVRQENGTWAFAGRSKKGGVIFHEKLRECAHHLQA
jgi:cytochrome c biogenesis protein